MSAEAGVPSAVPGTLQAPQVRAMFDRIAGMYDVLNGVMSAGLHHQWRRRAVDLAGLKAGDRVLDIAAGTGDLTIELASRVGVDGEVIGCDFSEEMLAIARRKAPALRFEVADALALPYGDDRFDAATVGFAARNFSDLDRGIAEMVRVVRPGGHIVILDFTTPRRAPLSTFHRLWFDRIVPVLGRLVGQPQAYGYLAESVRRYPDPESIAAVMQRGGLEQIRYIITGGGIVTIHVGRVTQRTGT